MKDKYISIVLGMLFVLNSNAQSVVPYEKWINKDTCWIFNSFRSVGVADGDTICIKKSYQLTLPKTIINYSETANEALFVLKHNQYIFVRRSTIETIASEELIDIDEFISFFDNILTNQDKKAISKAKRNNKKRKNYYMKMANGINILLYNIKKKELQALISIIKNNI